MVPLRSTVLLLALVSQAPAVEIRVATFNIGAHFGTSYFDYSLGDPGTTDHDTVRDILDRIDADVVALQEIHSADVDDGESPNDLEVLAANLGYPYLYLAPDNGSAGMPAPFDNSLQNAILSRYPIVAATSIRSPAGAKELTRLHPAVTIDVPGTTRDPLIIATHLKAGTTTADRFRRAVEMKRLTAHLSASGLTNDDNFIILGDFNPSSSSTTFYTLPSGLPDSYDLGDDISFPVSYSTNPLAYFTSPTAVRLDPRQLDGSDSTFGTTSPNGPTLDLLLVSPAIAGRLRDSEVYNSEFDDSNATGLPKAGSPLPPATSMLASDHYAVFADLELDGDYPDLDLALNAASVTEGMPDGTVSVTVTLPAIAPQPVTVNLISDDPASVMPLAAGIDIPAGSLGGNIALRVPRNFIEDGSRGIAITAEAPGYDPDSAVLQVEDSDGPYAFNTPGQSLTENFDGFGGAHDPAPWTTSGGAEWRGIDAGDSIAAGWRSYGSGSDGSLGFLPEGNAATASTTFLNQSPLPLTALRIELDAEQWRGALNGTADSLSVDLLIDGNVIPLPDLSWSASQALPTGPVAGGTGTTLGATVSGLAIPPGGDFGLRVAFTPGPGGGALPDAIFLNEFHYDNVDTDSGEFIEIAVGRGFAGDLSSIEIALYNGNTSSAAVVYDTLNLAADFSLTGIHGGYGIYSIDLPVNGLQNGANDGFAIVNTATAEVLQLLSYEGVFTAASGPAAGLTSIPIGVSEGGSTPVGASLGLTGSGSTSADFTWAVFTNHTQGAPNAGQDFVLPATPSQGIAIDNLSVTFLSDTDLDGSPDSLDPDDDNDGQSDAYEIAFGSDPLDGRSRFEPRITRAGGLQLSFHGAAGVTYVVECGTTLDDWDELSTHPGTGQPVIVPLPSGVPAMFFRVRADN